MSNAERMFQQRGVTYLALLLLASMAAACGLPTPTDRMKKSLSKHGTVTADWELRDETGSKTHTYVVLGTKSGTHETYEITATDGQNVVTREQVGGIDGTGCFLLPTGLTSQWILQQDPKTLEGTRKSGEKTRTACLEYKETAAWTAVPEKERKAAEPPPPPPPSKKVPDAGTSDGGKPDPGEVKSAIP